MAVSRIETLGKTNVEKLCVPSDHRVLRALRPAACGHLP